MAHEVVRTPMGAPSRERPHGPEHVPRSTTPGADRLKHGAPPQGTTGPNYGAPRGQPTGHHLTPKQKGPPMGHQRSQAQPAARTNTGPRNTARIRFRRCPQKCAHYLWTHFWWELCVFYAFKNTGHTPWGTTKNTFSGHHLAKIRGTTLGHHRPKYGAPHAGHHWAKIRGTIGPNYGAPPWAN